MVETMVVETMVVETTQWWGERGTGTERPRSHTPERAHRKRGAEGPGAGGLGLTL
jgi:hypothetical protein